MDENEAILQSFAAQGADLSEERPVEFQHLLPDGDAARAFAEAAAGRGYEVAMHEPDEEDLEEGFTEWDVVCTRTFVPTAAEITEIESSLAALAGEHGGTADGWGFFA